VLVVMRHRLLLALVLTAVAAPRAGAGGLAFGPAVFVTNGGGEPSLAIGPDQALYVSTLAGGHDVVAKSTNHGATWTDLGGTNGPFGGSDDHVVVAPDNAVYLAGQWGGSACVSVARGDNGGATWRTMPVACQTPLIDRPWLAVSRHGLLGYRLYLAYNDPCCFGRHVVARSDDGGLTWLGLGTVLGQFPGYILTDDDAGLVYTVSTRSSGLGREVTVSRSSDGGVTFTQHTAVRYDDPAGDWGLNHVFLAKDDSGALYTAWAENRDGTGIGIWLASSSDHGDSWTQPAKVSDTPGTHVYPAVAAGAPGHVVVSWYETSADARPRDVPEGAAWHPRAAETLDGTVWSHADVTNAANHIGPLCTSGSSCHSGRGLLDFFMVQIDADEHANIAWASDTGGVRRVLFARSQ
jgi:hypothetical protein